MLRRSAAAPAAPGAFVFPGGGVDGVDARVVAQGLVCGLRDDEAAERLTLATGAREFYAAALRELFEEAGLLLACDAAGHPVATSTAVRDRWRAEVLKGTTEWDALLAREGLRLDLGLVTYLAHWVTPRDRPRRFDTRFFVVRAPEGQVARADGRETTEHVWTSAAQALALVDCGEWTMLVPTVHTLRRLSHYSRVDDVLGDAARSSVVRVQPRDVMRDGRMVVVVPGEEGDDVD